MLNISIEKVKKISLFYKTRDDFTFQDVIINIFLICLGYSRDARNLN